ncbi:MAG TPA: amino acid adenylation domain-containing protein [Pyrinomonadaceae bacterium]|nr:amino acid adenylation domain-containing protein [Pyrinomonadaceae bacterium]
MRVEQSNISKAKSDLLQRYLLGDLKQPLATPSAIERRARNNSAPLSFGQERLWFLDQLEPNSSFYNTPAAMRLAGPLDVAALEQSLNEIVRRHEVLRTSFTNVDGRPEQVIAATLEVKLELLDLRGLPESERRSEASRLINEEAARPFNLREAPLFRAGLLRLAEDEHVLMVNMHHIISDDWSLGVLFREISSLYEAFSTGKSSTLPELPIQYADYAAWQREWLSGATLEKQLRYWKEQLSGELPVLELPADHPRPAVQSFRGARQSISLPKDLSAGIKSLGQREGATLFITLLAAFKVLLYRYTGQEDVLIGSAIANRHRAETEGLIGFFVNTLPLRTHLSGNPTFLTLLSRARETALGAYSNQDLPFEKLVRELQPERDISRNPLFQIMFALQNPPAPALDLQGFRLQPVEIDKSTAQFDLAFFVWEETGEVHAATEYSTDLFEAATIERMLGHFRVLVEAIVSNPDRRLSDLPILSEAEKERLLIEWKGARTDYPRNKCVHELFAEQVERAPDAVAVTFEHQRLTYKELDLRSNQLAHHLRKHGVGPEVPVGICIERSLEMVVALLGVLKSGGAYVPLDPSSPQKRLKLMLDDAGVTVVLVQEHLRERLPAHRARIIAVDSDWKTVARESTESLPNECTATNLAYVMYTSGSTGSPKGVSVMHRSVVRLVKETNYARLAADEVFLQFAPLSFDASTFEIWGSLLNGARLVMMPPGLPSLAELGAKVQVDQVTTLWLTAGLFHQMVELQLESLRGVRQLLAGGDVLSVPHIEKVSRELSGCQLINGYGPTENTTFTCCYRVKPAERFESSVPVGIPISNTEVYILDREMAPVPIGVTGELFIGGDGLARGYLNDPVKTARKFVPHRFSDRPGERLYRTGDQARYLADGRIEFLGRIDDQVKVRGFRIELGEIEAVLNEHKSVRQSVVIAREDRAGDKQLVAYVVLSDEVETIISDLRRWVKQQLPDYMVPSSFVVLDELPLTANGKLDRRALPAPDGKQFLKNTYIAPRNTLEMMLTKIWEKVLEVQPIGIKDNFFDLGGHSLLAVRVFAQIKKVCGKNLPLATLFQSPTVEQLANLLSEEKWSPSWSSLVAIQPGGSRPPLFCLHLALGHVLFYRELAERLGKDQPVYAFQPQGLDGTLPRHTRIEEMAAHYIKEMRTLQPEGPYYLGGSSFGGLLAFEMAQQLHAQGEKIAVLALFDTYAPGYEGPSPSGAGSLRRQGHLLLQRVNLHVVNLILLEREGKKKYVREKAKLVKGRLKGKMKAFETKVRNMLRKLSRSNGHFVPADDKPEIDIAFQALRDYVPQIYPGRVTLFRASKRSLGDKTDRDLGWGKLAAGGVEIHEIPGYHGSIVMEPRVRILAQKLEACISQTIMDRQS